MDYIDEINIEYRKLYIFYERNIPYEIKQDFYSQVDRSLAQDINRDLMDEIHAFFMESIGE
jgi:hypothetical protein